MLCYACSKKSDKVLESEYLANYIEKVHVGNQAKWVVILPGLGCPGCIEEGEYFFKNNIQNKDCYFIITSVQSLKILKHKVGHDFTTFDNVYIDTDNSLRIPTKNSIYPCIVQIDKGSIIGHEFQSPDNSQALYNLKSRLQL